MPAVRGEAAGGSPKREATASPSAGFLVPAGRQKASCHRAGDRALKAGSPHEPLPI